MESSWFKVPSIVEPQLRDGELYKYQVEGKSENMKGKNLYLSFWRLLPEAREKSDEYWKENWWPKHDELCKKYGLKLVYVGSPYGVPESNIFVYEGSCDTEKYFDFRLETNATERAIDYSNTTIVQLLDKP